jgi:hypothetical protein
LSFTKQTVWKKFIESIKIDFFFKHSSFLNLCNHHYLLFKTFGNYRENLNEKRLAEAWYQFNIILFDNEFYETKIHFYGEMIRNWDNWLKMVC